MFRHFRLWTGRQEIAGKFLVFSLVSGRLGMHALHLQNMENSTANATGTTARSLELTEQPFEVYKYYYGRQIMAGLCITISIVGVVGNTMVIAAVPMSRKLRTVTNLFVVNLSLSDLLSSLFMPWEAVSVLDVNGWPLPQAYWLCVITSAVTLLSSGCSVSNLALIAVNRWIGITKSSATSRRIYTHRNIAFMVAYSWAIPISVIVIPPLNGFGELGYEPKYGTCSWVKANPFSFIQNILLGILHFPLHLCIICLCYISIFRYVLKTSRRMARYDTKSVSGTVSGSDRAMRKKLWKRQIAVTKNLVYIVLAYVICLAPFFVSVLPLGYDWSIRMTPYAGAVVFFNSCINPIIYAKSHPDFKEAFGNMVRCQCNAIFKNKAGTHMIKSSNAARQK